MDTKIITVFSYVFYYNQSFLKKNGKKGLYKLKYIMNYV